MAEQHTVKHTRQRLGADVHKAFFSSKGLLFMTCHLEPGQCDPLGLSHCQLTLGGTRIHVHTLPVCQVKRLFCHYLPILTC